jgi:Zn-dependent metalloprotease
MKRPLLVILIVFSLLNHAQAQQSLSANPNTPVTGKYYYAGGNEAPRAIEFEPGVVSVASFIANINHHLQVPSTFTFTEIEVNTDRLGMRHHLLQQYYNGVPIENMLYRVHERDGFVRSANGRAIRTDAIDLHSVLSEEQAFFQAKMIVHSTDTTRKHGKRLIVSKNFTNAPESFSLAYQYDIDVSLIEQWRVSIDARNGALINKVSLINDCNRGAAHLPFEYSTGTGKSSYYGTRTIKVDQYANGSSRMVGETQSGGKIGTYDFRNASVRFFQFGFYNVYDFFSEDNNFDSDYDKPAVSVQWGAEHAYEYYFKKFNRQSYDNANSEIRLFVHVDQNLNNAFWARNTLLFGDGSNNNPLVELDVVSHELTHGVTQYEANLQYYFEPGALNESFSDIFGKAIEFDTFGDTATWQLARYYRDGGLRDFSNPNLKQQPDTYEGHLWYTGGGDNGGVHYNSGVQNYWYYLLCVGGGGVNDHQKNYSVQSIGMDAASAIAYRNLTEYLSTGSDYLDSRIGSLLAAADLYGSNSFIYQQVDAAWDAVGVINEPIIKSLQLYDVTATTVKIKGSLVKRGAEVDYHFEYGTTPALGSSTSLVRYVDKVEGMLTGLQSQTKYYLRLVATNENGSSFRDTTFTTLSLAPLVKIRQTVDVTESTAKLYGEVNPNSLAASFYFEYGLTPALGSTTPPVPIAESTEFGDVTSAVTNLQPRSTYYYRLVAVNTFGSAHTGTVKLYTASKPAITSYTPATAPIHASLTIFGNNFNPVAGKNIVTFGATRATVVAATTTQLNVTVPAGASLGPIKVVDTESGLAGSSPQDFVPTYTGNFNAGSLQLVAGVSDVDVYQILVSDMDGDGKPDILGNHSMGFSVFQNVIQGGTITNESFVRSTYAFSFNTPIRLADMDGNGLMDVVGGYGDGLRIYRNLSVPGYIFFGVPIDVHTGYMRDFSCNDFDQDGRADIALIGYIPSDSSLIKTYRNENGHDTFEGSRFRLQYEKGVPYQAYHLTSDDLDNDGKPEMIVGPNERKFAAIFENKTQSGQIQFDEHFIQDAAAPNFAKYSAHDLNEDGWRDVISNSVWEVGNVSVFENKKTDTPLSLATPLVAYSGHVNSALSPADINGDGKVDLVVGIYDGRFTILKNNTPSGTPITSSSFEVLPSFGNQSSQSTSSDIVINDLNGDGRPEVINRNRPDGANVSYSMEIFQNVSNTCTDVAGITLELTHNTARIILPESTTWDNFEIFYQGVGAHWWDPATPELTYLSSGFPYRLRVRGKCTVGYTPYFYIDFTPPCVDINSFSIHEIGVDYVKLSAVDMTSIEVQYSIAGHGQWFSLGMFETQIHYLQPGTTYDLIYRERCHIPTEYRATQFTTLCPMLIDLYVAQKTPYTAEIGWTANYSGEPLIEYSSDQSNWIRVAPGRRITSLTPGMQYYLRGKTECPNGTSHYVHRTFTLPCPKLSTVYVNRITATGATVYWSDPNNNGLYVLTYFLEGGGTPTTIETHDKAYLITGLASGSSYQVSVAPKCLGDEDFTSSSFTTECPLPANVQVQSISYTTALISWDDSFSGLSHHIEYSVAGKDEHKIIEASSLSTELRDLRPGTRYEIKIYIDCLGKTPPYVMKTFETKVYSTTTVAPNPTNDKIIIYPSRDLIGMSFQLLDFTGKLAGEGTLNDYTFDLSGLPEGIYILRIEGEDPMKIVKHHP